MQKSVYIHFIVIWRKLQLDVIEHIINENCSFFEEYNPFSLDSLLSKENTAQAWPKKLFNLGSSFFDRRKYSFKIPSKHLF